MGNDEPTDDPLIEWLRDTVGPGPFVPQSIYGAVLATLSALDAARFRLEAVTTDWKFEVRRAQSWRLAADTWQQRAEAAEAETLRLRAELAEADRKAKTFRKVADEAIPALQAADAKLEQIAALHQPHDVRHFSRTTVPIGPYEPWMPGPDDPYEIKQHCGTCECGKDDWPCATAAVLGGTE